METALLILTSGSFLVFWITIVVFYTPSCHNLREMIDSIKQDGDLTRTKSKWMWYGRSAKTIDDWLITLPVEDKYLKYGLVQTTVNRIKIYRRIIMITAPIMVVSGTVLLITVE